VNKEELAPWTSLEEVVPVELLKAEVQAWARRIGVAPYAIHIRPMKRKWASCSAKGRLTFDVDLLRQPARFRAEVIVHEVLHLKVPNHGKLFRSLLRAYLEQAPRRVD
jgi:predicted metal-dependent hydrolase